MASIDRRAFLHTGAGLASGAAVFRALAAEEEAPQGAPKSPPNPGPGAGPVAPGAGAVIDEQKPGTTRKTRFAVNIEMWFRKIPSYLDKIRAAADLGYSAVEIWPYQNKDIEATAKLCSQLGIHIAQFTAWPFEPGMNNPKNHDLVEQRIEEACQVAKRLNVNKMCVVGGNDQPGMTQQQMHENIITALKRVAPIAERHQVMLVLEPMNIRVDHKGHCLYGSPAAVKICRAVNSPYVKILWDLYHMHISEGDLCGHLKEGFDQLGYVQLADHPGRNEPGTGEIHYNRVLRQLWELGYRDYVGLELVPKTTDRAAAIAVAKADVW